MASVAHVTPRHLTRLFQQHAGMSPRQHVELVRLTLAREAHGSGMSRERAADLAGFSSTRQWRRARTRQADWAAITPTASPRLIRPPRPRSRP